MSVFRCPKRVIGVLCLCLCLRDRPPNFLCRCPACPFVGKGTTLSNARRQVKGHALRAHEAIFRPERDTLQQLGPDELRSQLEVFRRGQRSAPRRRAAAARVAVGEGTPGLGALCPVPRATLFLAPRPADPWKRSSALSRRSIFSRRTRTPTRRPTPATSLQEDFQHRRWSITSPMWLRCYGRRPSSGRSPALSRMPRPPTGCRWWRGCSVVWQPPSPPRSRTRPLRALPTGASWTPPRRSSPAGDGAHSTWSDVNSVCDGRWPLWMPLPDLRASHVIVSGVVVRRSVTDAEFDAVTLLFLFRRWNACCCLIVDCIAV